jgi:integrase
MYLFKRCKCPKKDKPRCADPYWYEFVDRGERLRASTGCSDRAEAETFTKVIRGELAKSGAGGAIARARNSPSGSLTIATLLERDLAEAVARGGRSGKEIAPGTLTGLHYAHQKIREFCSLKDTESPSAISHDFIVDYINHRRAQVGSNTIGREIQVWKRIHLSAAEKGYTSGVMRWPKLRGGSIDKQMQGQNVPLDVLRTFLSYLPQEHRDLYGVAMYTGWRNGTLFRLLPRYFERSPQGAVFANLPEDSMKGRDDFYSPVSEQAWAIIERRIRAQGPQELVFKPFDYSRQMKNALEETNVERLRMGLPPYNDTITLRDVRTTYENLLLEQGVDPTTVMSLMNHKDLKTTAIYQRPRLERLAAATVTVSALLPSVGQSPQKVPTPEIVQVYSVDTPLPIDSSSNGLENNFNDFGFDGSRHVLCLPENTSPVPTQSPQVEEAVRNALALGYLLGIQAVSSGQKK